MFRRPLRFSAGAGFLTAGLPGGGNFELGRSGRVGAMASVRIMRTSIEQVDWLPHFRQDGEPRKRSDGGLFAFVLGVGRFRHARMEEYQQRGRLRGVPFADMIEGFGRTGGGRSRSR